MQQSQAGARHIVSSTYKARPGNLKRITSAFPDAGVALKMQFQKGCRASGSLLLPGELRCSLMQKVEDSASRMGVTILHLPGRQRISPWHKLRWIASIAVRQFEHEFMHYNAT